MTRALVTNDDGIDAPGLHALARAALEAGLDVVVAAPAVQSSGSSASITASEADGRIQVETRAIEGLEGVPAYAVHGGPGLIALIASRGAFGEPADLVLSGVNHGANVGRAILHSGTVGAALTAGLNGAWGVAASLDVGLRPVELHWPTAAAEVVDLLPWLLGRPRGTVLNVNVPNTDAPRGVVEARLAPFGVVQTTLVEHEEQFIRLAVEDLPAMPEPGTDAAYLGAGWVTVTGLVSVSDMRIGLTGVREESGRRGRHARSPEPDLSRAG